jgi:uncharacterized protein (DUF305 family)
MGIAAVYRVATYGMALGLSILAAPALAEPTTSMHAMPMDMASGQLHGANDGAAAAPSTAAYQANAQSMMNAMSAESYTGDADADFVAHMIPHHQGAVDQAQVELRYGKDPQMKALAANIIQSQRQEIELMKKWQSLHKAP